MSRRGPKTATVRTRWWSRGFAAIAAVFFFGALYGVLYWLSSDSDFRHQASVEQVAFKAGFDSVRVDEDTGTVHLATDEGERYAITFKDYESVSLLDIRDNVLSYTDETGRIKQFRLADQSIDPGRVYSDLNKVDNTLSFVDNQGARQSIDLDDTVKALETVTSLTSNQEGKLEFVNETGTVQTIDMQLKPETVTSLVSNGDGTITFTDESGVSTTISLTQAQNVTELVEGNGSFTFTNELGESTVIDMTDSLHGSGDVVVTGDGTVGSPYVIDFSETHTSVVIDDQAQTATFTNEAGTKIVIDIGTLETTTSLEDNGDGTFKFTNEDGVEVAVDTTDSVEGDGDVEVTGSGTSSDPYVVSFSETATKLVIDESAQTAKYTNEDGTEVAIDIKKLETTTSLEDNGDGTFKFTNEDGVEVAIDTTDSVEGDGDVEVTGSGTSSDPYVVSFSETVTKLVVDESAQTAKFTNEDGTEVTIDVAKLETVSALEDNGDGSFTYTDEDGVKVTIDVAELETTTKLSINESAQTATYKNEDGTEVTLDITKLESVSTLKDNSDGTYTYTNEDGTTTKITDTIAGLSCSDTQVAIFDNSSSGWKCADQDDSLGDLSCDDGEVAAYDNTNGEWECVESSDTLADLTCSGDQIAVYDATNKVWKCSDQASDADWLTSSDGVPGSIDDDIYTKGKVGIGTKNPEKKLDIDAGADTSVSIKLGAGSQSAESYLTLWQDTNDGNSYKTSLIAGSETVLTALNQSGKVGIGTTNPTKTLTIDSGDDDESGLNLARLTSATDVTSDARAIGVDSDGNVVTVAVATSGDVKQGIQTNDHGGWVLLDGRALSTLTAEQQAVASTLGLAGNLPNGSGTYLSQNGNALGSVSGSNSRTISKANLPKITLSGTTNTTGNHSHKLRIEHRINGSRGGTSASGKIWTGYENETYTLTTAGAHKHSVSVPLGGSGQAIDIKPRTLSVNFFIYLG